MLTINGKCIKLGSTKIKNFCSSKYTIKGIKKQPKKWDIYLQYIYSTKDLYSEYGFLSTYN